MAGLGRLGRTAARTAGRVLHHLLRSPAAGSSRPRPTRPRPAGAPDVEYRPRDDGRPDPGEIVWAWVPFEEDDGRGKDRPVLVIGRRGGDLLGLMLTSRDHDRDAADEARHGRVWTDIGSGAWDPRGRPSEVRLDRLLELDPATVRREGAALDRARFDRVVGEARRVQGW
ncbi:type II toxin-antitoxin system PemK/MazF family toxin [Blastococcus sp. KM273128]|uniref:type II toxin-antitoxin system PemK/MazF family toxin n=1 Tax=Blastococcus sp. KM273128 TaxID=2570314 RepID=UPI001F2F42EA|nr:type II toxin-antitoxin system PemK/MazF family toxin [Blastococcus sp. KM273128]MCF6746584.1 type II toxin-antitoxin system PemK/MazF family toxin [Blastococcus sp. KM273128]